MSEELIDNTIHPRTILIVQCLRREITKVYK